MENLARLRIYVDTSVFGGCFDKGFAEMSTRLFERARRSELVILISDLVLEELSSAPEPVQEILRSLPTGALESLHLSEEILGLRDAYINAGVLGSSHASDACHVAAASVAGVDAIVSWNFRHIVNLDRMKGFNKVNTLRGYRILTILSPLEVVGDDPNDRETTHSGL